MPITESVTISYAVFASIASAVVALLASSTPGTEDAWAVVGAMMAGAISVIHAMRSQKSMWDLAAVLVAAAFCGAVAPGVIINIQFPHMAERMTWHAWAASGFISGLAGWSLTRGIISFFDKLDWLSSIKRTVLRLFGVKGGDDTTKPPGQN